MAIVKHVAEPATFSEIIREVGVTAEDMRIVESVYRERERKSGKTKKAAAKKATGGSAMRRTPSG